MGISASLYPLLTINGDTRPAAATNTLVTPEEENVEMENYHAGY